MSFAALAAIRGVDAPGPSALLILFVLAEYAGADGCCYPSQKTLAQRAKLSERAVRDNLNLLEEAGLIRQQRRTRRDGTRTSNRIQLAYYTPEETESAGGNGNPDPPAKSAGSLSAASGSDLPAIPAGSLDEGDNDYRQLTPSLPAAAAGLTSFEPVSEPIRETSLSFVGEIEFEEVRLAWQAADPAYVMWNKARAAWCEWCGPHWSPSQLRDGLLSWLKYRQRGGSSTPEWLHVLIGRGPDAWAHLIPKQPNANGVRTEQQQGFPGATIDVPHEIADQLMSAAQDVRACLLGATWRGSDRTIVTRSQWGADELERRVGPLVLRRLDVRVEGSARGERAA